MDIFISQLEGAVPVTKIRLTGDFSDGNRFTNVVKHVIEQRGNYILVDLSGVPFISSSGLRGIHSAFEQLNHIHQADQHAITQGIASGQYKSPYLKLLAPSENSLRALAVGGFDMFLTIHKSETDALNAFKGSI